MFVRAWVIRVGIIVFFNFLSGCNGRQENTERRQLFDLNWKFYPGDISSAYAVDLNDIHWSDIDLPHDWSKDRNLFKRNLTDSLMMHIPDGVGWYRKKFIIPADWKDKRVSVIFEGIHLNPEIYINEIALTDKQFSKSSFTYELTSYLYFNKENTIAVRVMNKTQKSGGWENGSGIYNHVWLEIKDPVYFKQ